MALLKCNTRFNPTVNGGLHIGHLYNALVNAHEAHRTGGKFILRLEDDQEGWAWTLGEAETRRVADGIIDDLAWFGVKVDRITYQSEQAAEMKRLLYHLDKYRLVDRLANLYHYAGCEVLASGGIPYPYAPHLTAERVVMDAMDEVNLVIRGEDLLSEDCLYALFCEVLRIALPRRVYIPRLRFSGGGELLAEVSKTSGNQKIADYRAAGWTPAQLEAKLRDACLVDPQGEWRLENVQKDPRWSI